MPIQYAVHDKLNSFFKSLDVLDESVERKKLPAEVVVEKWGEAPDPFCIWNGSTKFYNHNLANWLVDVIHYRLLSLEEQVATYGYSTDSLRQIIARCEPAPSTEKPSMLAIWPDRRSLDQGEKKRTRMKPGKAFRKMFPWLSQANIDFLVDNYLVHFAIEACNYTIKVGDTAEDFKHAYSHEHAEMANLYTNMYRKSLANSCLRYDFNHFPYHPAEAYASGDFKIIWVEDKVGRIAARCVFGVPKGIAAPIYGVNEVVVDMVEAYVTEELKGTHWQGESNPWDGLLLVAHEWDGDGYIAPYLDMDEAVTPEGDYLRIDSFGSIGAKDHEGILGSHIEHCVHCRAHVHPDDDPYIEEADGFVCGSCISDYTYCYHREEWTSEPAVEVWYASKWLNTPQYYRELWCQSSADYYAVLCTDGEYWRDEDVIELANGDYASPRDVANGDYVECSISGEYYSRNEMLILDGEYVHEDQIDPDEHVFDDAIGEYVTREETDEEEEKEEAYVA